MNMAVKLTTVLSLFSVLCVFSMTAEALDCELVKKLADLVGRNLTKFFRNVTHINGPQNRYVYGDSAELYMSVTAKDGPSIANKMKTHLEGILEKKIKSIKHLAAMTEELRENYTYDPNLKETPYFNSKYLEGLELEKDPTFSHEIEINTNSSTVHVPTDVYSGGVKIVNTIKWTAGLEKYFLENKKDEPSLLWQYFGSADGVYRVYPAFKWPIPSNEDMFDNRRRGWYIQGSSSPKDIVIVMDLSGSMLGSKLAIAKLAAMSLLDTLQENDFVHVVVVYKSIPGLVCQVSKNGSEVLPLDKVPDCPPNLMLATEQNKKFLVHSIPNVKAFGIAAASKGINTAITVLKESRSKYNYSSSDCTQAIILFTDGIEDNEADRSKTILQENNADKKIRLFTYLLGREKGVNDKPLQEMSAEYRGCLFRIETLSDVREKVHLYMTVLSRALGFSDHRTDASWTPIYLDRLGLGLMITIVAPVFNTTGEYKGGLLGVVGTDVALPELEDSVPSGETGVNGYGFAINNNGFVLFHPSLRKELIRKYCRPTRGSKLSANKVKEPPNISFNDVEYNSSDAKILMRHMIDRKTGQETFLNRLISNDKNRASFLEEYHYFYSPIANTSFSAAVGIPKHGLNALYVNKSFVTDVNDLKPVNGEEVIIAPWKICSQVNIAAKSRSPVYQPSYATAEDIRNDSNYTFNCDKDKLRHLLFDAKQTRRIVEEWNVAENDTRGIQNVFVGTQGGIMRLLNPGIKPNPFQRDYVKEQFYSQAAQYASKGEGIVVFSAPYQHPDYRNENNESSPEVTASSSIVFGEPGNQTIVAVVGMQIDGESLRDRFLSAISGFTDECNDSETCSLRLIDNDGFVVASNDKEKSEAVTGFSPFSASCRFIWDCNWIGVGKFVGVLEGAAMREFLNRSLFQGLAFIDVQGECKKREEGTSSARTLLNPLFAVTSYVQFWTQTIFWSLTQFNAYNFFSGSNVATAEENGGGDDPVVFPCTNELKFYKAVEQTNRVTHCERLTCLENCNSYVALTDVPDTNLRLLVVKDPCPCDENSQLTTKPIQESSDKLKATFNQYRTPPIVQTPCNDLVDQDKPPCALGSLSSPHLLFTILMAILGSCLGHNHLWRRATG